MYAYTVNASMHLFLLEKCTDAFKALWAKGLPVFLQAKKSPRIGGLCLT